MKRILITFAAAAALFSSSAFASNDPVPLPDSGSLIGMLGLGLLVMVGLRRKFSK